MMRGTRLGLVIQYLHTRVWTTDGDVLAATGGRFRADSRPEEIQPGRLAFKWFPEDEADCMQRDFVTLTALGWKALKAVTAHRHRGR